MTAFADEVSAGFEITEVTSSGGKGMESVTLPLPSPFGDTIVGQISIMPNQQWTNKLATETAVKTIAGLVIVISLLVLRPINPDLCFSPVSASGA